MVASLRKTDEHFVKISFSSQLPTELPAYGETYLFFLLAQAEGEIMRGVEQGEDCGHRPQ